MYFEPKACRACARSKRKCGREQPACLRCRARGAACEYPPMRAGFHHIVDETYPTLTPPSTASTTASESSPTISPDATHTGAPNDTPCALPIGSRQCLAWFLNADSWTVDRQEADLSTSFCSAFLKRYVSQLQDMLGEWVTTGSNPFIHANLYAARFPDCLQIAFTTLTTYRARTPQNAEIVLKIVEDQASKLVGTDSTESILSPTEGVATHLGLLDQVARLHALVVYQTISLFDGDIRSRHLAEARLLLLRKWAQQLLDSARAKFSSTPAVLDMTNALYFGPMDSQEHPWYLWILCETIRRAWLIARGLEAIYCMLKRGWHPCPGGVMFTTRKGIWDAPSALAWEAACAAGVDESRGVTGAEAVGFVHRFETHRLFATTTPDKVDEFTILMMATTFGQERMEKWRQEAQAAGSVS